MRLANHKFLYKSSIFLFLLACSEKEPSPFGNPDWDLDGNDSKNELELNLRSTDSGDNLNSVTITWNNLGSAELTDHSSMPPINITTSGNSHTFSEMAPGEFRDIKIKIITNDSTYVDSIQIFTRPIYPASNVEVAVETIKVGENVWNSWEEFVDKGNDIWDPGEEFDDMVNGIWDIGEEFVDNNNNGIWDPGEEFDDMVNGIWDPGESFTDLGNGIWDIGEVYDDDDTIKYHRNLTWSPTLESQGDPLKYYIYRSEDPSNLMCINCKIESLSISDSIYIDSSSLVINEPNKSAYFYMVQVSSSNFTQNSFIYNYTGPQVGPVTGVTVSKDKNEFIELRWNPIDNNDYFYQYEIKRALGNDTLSVVIILNSEISHFADQSNDFIDGTTYSYSIIVWDIGGNPQPKLPIFIEGFSNPWN